MLSVIWSWYKLDISTLSYLCLMSISFLIHYDLFCFNDCVLFYTEVWILCISICLLFILFSLLLKSGHKYNNKVNIMECQAYAFFYSCMTFFETLIHVKLFFTVGDTNFSFVFLLFFFSFSQLKLQIFLLCFYYFFHVPLQFFNIIFRRDFSVYICFSQTLATHTIQT